MNAPMPRAQFTLTQWAGKAILTKKPNVVFLDINIFALLSGIKVPRVLHQDP
jgi:DNA-binding LytR/AlgR family response regulator